LITLSLARKRFLIVLRPMTNEPHLYDRVQKWVKPKKSNVPGFCRATIKVRQRIASA